MHFYWPVTAKEITKLYRKFYTYSTADAADGTPLMSKADFVTLPGERGASALLCFVLLWLPVPSLGSYSAAPSTHHHNNCVRERIVQSWR